MAESYNPRVYWEERLAQSVDITRVGHIGLGYAFNAWLYRARFRAMERALRGAALPVTGKTLLECGVGSGAWLPFWQQRGIGTLVGLDLTRASTTALQRRYLQYSFVQGNIAEALPFAPATHFDLVTAFDVLFHIVDDAAFARAVTNIGALLRPGGHALISDSFCARPWGPTYHEYHRTQQHYLDALSHAGLEPIYIEPIFFTMTTPLCAGDTVAGKALDGAVALLLKLLIKLAARPQTAWLNDLIGGTLYWIDGLLGQSGASGPSLKILCARKRH